MEEGLQILKGGRLLKTYWDSSTRTHNQKDITDRAISHLFEPCDLEEGVTLRDIFTLINSELQIFDSVLRNWTDEIVTEGLSGQSKSKKEREEDIEYLELYWAGYKSKDYHTKEPIFYGQHRAEFHGIGPELKEDKLHSWGDIEYPKGSRITWGISFTPAYDMIDIPVKLNKEFVIYDDDDWKQPPQNLGKTDFTLGQILYGILWEMSFHGGPESRDKQGDELKAAVDEIQDLKSTKDVEELFKELKDEEIPSE